MKWRKTNCGNYSYNGCSIKKIKSGNMRGLWKATCNNEEGTKYSLGYWDTLKKAKLETEYHVSSCRFAKRKN